MSSVCSTETELRRMMIGRRFLQEPPLQYTPEQVERIQRDFIQEVFRSLDTEAKLCCG